MRWLSLLLLVALATAQYQPLSPIDPAPYEQRTELAAAGDLTQAQRVLRFVQISDAHVIDDDLPLPFRQVELDPVFAPITPSQARPQEEFTDEVLDSVVRAINALHAEDPVDFVINTGDNIDNQLENELFRFLDNFEGTHTTVGPISGLACAPDGASVDMDDTSNDQVTSCTSLPPALAANNTPLAPDLPWYSAFGNHDGLIQGNVPVTYGLEQGIGAFGRHFIDQTEYVDMHFVQAASCIGGSPAGSFEDDFGHGFGFAGARLCDEDPDNDGYYSFVRNGVRFVVLDTVNDDYGSANEMLADVPPTETTLGRDIVGGYAEGAIDEVQYAWLQQQLQEGRDELIVIFAHHTINSMFADLAQFCPEPSCLADVLAAAGFRTGADLEALLSGHPNVAAFIGGHTHAHRIEAKTSFWNIETSSLVDFPQQARVIELWAAEGKGFLRMDRIDHDHDESRALEADDPQRDPTAEGGPEDQDVLLWFEVPSNVQLTPQPELPRELRILRTGGQSGDVGQDVQIVLSADDPIHGPVSGLDVTVDIGYPGAGFVNVVPAGTPVPETTPGTYAVTFTPQEPATHFATFDVTDPSGIYPPATRVFSVAIEGEAPVQESPFGLLWFLALAVLVRQKR